MTSTVYINKRATDATILMGRMATIGGVALSIGRLLVTNFNNIMDALQLISPS